MALLSGVSNKLGGSSIEGGLSVLNGSMSLFGKKSGAMLKGLVMNQTTKVPYMFQYNPTTLGYSRSAEYKEISAPGSSYPIVQYIKGNSREFEVELFFNDDNTYRGTIDLAREYFSAFLPPEDNKGGFSPPIMLFYYGTFIKKCVLTGLRVDIERHNKYGLPLRARFTLSLKQVGK